jgi:D-serine deaminase-like pyridoxal phosphate-dependent protein
MAADYASNDPPPPFAQSLFVLTTVMSTPRPGLAKVDAGLKALALDSGMPLVWNRPAAQPVRVRERIQLVPGRDPTVDCYDWYVECRGNRVEFLWPVAARGGIA